MPSSNRMTIANLGLPGYINATAYLHNGKDWAWLDEQAARLDEQDARFKAGDKIPKAEQITKKDMYEAMGVIANTLDKYLTLRKIERVQDSGDHE